MILHILNSRSAGNCYILEGKTEALILEAGVSFQKVKEVLNFDISKIVACLITHEHGDHAGKVKEYLKYGINCLASKGTWKAVNPPNTARCMVLYNKYNTRLGKFTVLPFDVKHNVAEPMGFLIYHPECGHICFITDSIFVPYTFKNLNHILIEANYSEAILNENVLSGKLNYYQAESVRKNHMSIDTSLEFIQANDLSKVNNIILLHLSDGNSNAEQFKQLVEDNTGKNVIIADKNMKININKIPF